MYLLRAVQMGLSVADMELIDEGMVIDMLIEAVNDTADYTELASQSDMDNF